MSVPHGKCYYQKSVYVSRPPDSKLTKRIVERIVEVELKHQFSVVLSYELRPFNKILSVSNDATAHIRGARYPVMTVISWAEAWPDVSPEKLQTAKTVSTELLNIVLSGENNPTAADILGYGNYCKLSSEP